MPSSVNPIGETLRGARHVPSAFNAASYSSQAPERLSSHASSQSPSAVATTAGAICTEPGPPGKSTGRCEPLETPGTWLAALPDVSDVTVDSEITLAPGDLLVLYTDGVTEATNPGGEMLGVERVCQEIERVRQQPTTGVRDALVGLVRSWTAGAPLEDDVTLVVIRYTGKPATA